MNRSDLIDTFGISLQSDTRYRLTAWSPSLRHVAFWFDSLAVERVDLAPDGSLVANSDGSDPSVSRGRVAAVHILAVQCAALSREVGEHFGLDGTFIKAWASIKSF